VRWGELRRGLAAIDDGNGLEFLAPWFGQLPQGGASRLAGMVGLRLAPGEAFEAVEPFDDGGFFLRSRVFFLRCRPTWRARLLAGGRASLLVTFGVRGLRRLQGQPGELGELLREQTNPVIPDRPIDGVPYRRDDQLEEARLPSEADPLRLARLWALSTGSGTSLDHQVITPPERSTDLSPSPTPWAPQWVPITPFLSALIHAPSLVPTIEGDPQQGWELRFFTVLDSTSVRPTVTRQRVAIGHDFRVSSRQELIATEISVTPIVVGGRPLLVRGESREAPLKQGRGWG
jgi:hypothetical protein